MKFRANGIRLQFTEERWPEIVITPTERIEIVEAKGVIAKGKELAVEIKQYRKRRSNDANSYFWLLVGKLAAAMRTSTDEVYLLMLERYGVFTHIVVKPHIVEQVKKQWRTVRELGEVTVNGKTGIQLQCYFGSSTYDSLQMSVLIDGVVSECKDLGIETIPPAELESLKSQWGQEVEK